MIVLPTSILTLLLTVVSVNCVAIRNGSTGSEENEGIFPYARNIYDNTINTVKYYANSAKQSISNVYNTEKKMAHDTKTFIKNKFRAAGYTLKKVVDAIFDRILGPESRPDIDFRNIKADDVVMLRNKLNDFVSQQKILKPEVDAILKQFEEELKAQTCKENKQCNNVNSEISRGKDQLNVFIDDIHVGENINRGLNVLENAQKEGNNYLDSTKVENTARATNDFIKNLKETSNQLTEDSKAINQNQIASQNDAVDMELTKEINEFFNLDNVNKV